MANFLRNVYCEHCDALFKYDCKCPNNTKYKRYRSFNMSSEKEKKERCKRYRGKHSLNLIMEDINDFY